MFTPDERRALVFLAVLAAVGGVLRMVRHPREAPGAPLVVPELAGDDLAGQVAAVRRATLLARPLKPGERVDVDRAGPEELERLPRVGRELARRIVADREANGPFGSLETLSRVSGIGPTLLRELERVTSFSAVPAVAAQVADSGRGASGRGRPATGARPLDPACPATVAVNRATAAELTCLPGIGPALAARIVTDRTRHGGYRELQDLERVPGIGPRLRARLSGRAIVP